MRSILDSLGSLLLALLLAGFVWVASVRENNPSVRGVFPEAIPIEVKNKPAGLEFMDPTQADQRVQLAIVAPENSWEDLKANSFQAWIDLQGLSADIHDVEVQAKCSDKQVRIVSKQPSRMSIRLEPLKEKEVDVRVKILDEPGLGYQVGTAEANPARVKVVGPASTVDLVTSVLVDIRLSQAKATVERDVQVVAVDDQDNTVGWLKKIEPPSVRVTIPVVQRLGYRDVSVSVVRAGKVARGYRIAGVSVEPSIVTVVGNPKSLDEIPGYVGTQPVDIADAKANVSQKVALALPDGVSLLDTQLVQVDVSVVPLIDSVSLNRRVVPQGQRPGYRVVISPEAVEVIVSGPVPLLEALRPEEVPVVVDVLDLAPGIHKLRMRALVPQGLSVESIIPDSVQVEIILTPETPTASPTPTPTSTPTSTPDRTPTPTAAATRSR